MDLNSSCKTLIVLISGELTDKCLRKGYFIKQHFFRICLIINRICWYFLLYSDKCLEVFILLNCIKLEQIQGFCPDSKQKKSMFFLFQQGDKSEVCKERRWGRAVRRRRRGDQSQHIRAISLLRAGRWMLKRIVTVKTASLLMRIRTNHLTSNQDGFASNQHKGHQL